MTVHISTIVYNHVHIHTAE